MLKSYGMLVAYVVPPLLFVGFGRYYFADFMQQFTLPTTVANWCMLLLIAPVLEEIVFRGLIQDIALRFLRQVVGGRWYTAGTILALIAVNGLFAILHARINSNPWYLCIVFISGLIFSLVKIRYVRLIYPIGMHIYYNCVFIAMMFMQG